MAPEAVVEGQRGAEAGAVGVVATTGAGVAVLRLLGVVRLHDEEVTAGLALHAVGCDGSGRRP